jgi:hypothetical protein
MKISRLMLILACFIGLTQLVWGQKPAEAAGNDILGYLNPQTGAFRPMAQTSAATADAEALAALTPTGGTLVFNITITLKSALTADTFGCNANADVFDSGLDYHENAAITATGSGTSRTCKVTIPYSWTLATPTTDTVTLGINVADLSYITSKLPVPSRSHSRSLPPIKVPLGGATTTFNIAVTL